MRTVPRVFAVTISLMVSLLTSEMAIILLPVADTDEMFIFNGKYPIRMLTLLFMLTLAWTFPKKVGVEISKCVSCILGKILREKCCDQAQLNQLSHLLNYNIRIA